jgi:ribosomal protein S18 acetylase RimI-like enzyme
MEIAPFTPEYLDAAAGLLADRHRRHREAEPLLPDDVDFRAEIAALLENEDSSGVVARRDGRLVGYLIGAPRRDPRWGDHNAWIELAGHAVEEAEDVRDLYGAAAGRWVEEGLMRHSALVPATNAELVDSWFRLGFGQQQAHGVREVPGESSAVVPDGFEIRPPDPADIEALIDVDLALPAHQQLSPVFSGVARTSREESRAEWLSTIAGTDEEVLIGYRDGKPVACWSITSIEHSEQHSGLARPQKACYLGFAVTLPEARGSGIGVALTEACFDRARELGYETMVTDWRVTNLLASRFWPRRGFRTTFLRLYRSIP